MAPRAVAAVTWLTRGTGTACRRPRVSWACELAVRGLKAVFKLDLYLLRRTLPAMGAVLMSAGLALLLERLLRSVDLLAQSSRGAHFILRLAVELTPHYIGLVLPAGFFIGLFVVVNRLNQGSEIDAMLASGVSLGRIAAPLIALGLVLMAFSLVLYGFMQPYSRYGYRAVLHAAANAGWNGEIQFEALLSPSPDLTLTADEADPTGRILKGVFIRRLLQGREVVITAARADVFRSHDDRSLILELHRGEVLNTPAGGATRLFTFDRLKAPLPLIPAARLLRARGAIESELTLVELAQQGFGREPPVLSRQTLLAELYSRLARAIALPLMPLLAVLFALTAKRAGSAPAMAVAAVLLFVFQTSMIFTQGMAANGNLPASVAIGGPMAVFAGICIAAFVTSRRRPGENLVNWVAEHIGDALGALARRVRRGGWARFSSPRRAA